MNFYVAGVKHHKFYGVSDKLKEGDSVQLIPEPTNKFDKFAVGIKTVPEETMLGYVPATISEMVSNKIKEGKISEVKLLPLILKGTLVHIES